MQPTISPGNQPPRKKHWRLLAGVASVVALVVIALLVYQALTFHIVKTDPSMSKVGNYSPYIRLYFNKPLDGSTVSYTDKESILTNSTIEGKTITFNLKRGLTIGQQYSIVLNHVRSTSGDTIDNKVFTFMIKDIPVTSMSPEMQKEIVGRQDKYPYNVHNIPFKNFDALTNNGLTIDQEQIVKQALFNYSNQIKTKFTSVGLDTSSIVPGPFDPNTENPSRSLMFTVTANHIPYRLTVSYDNLTDAKVLIYDQSGVQVFDSTAPIDNLTNSVEE